MAGKNEVLGVASSTNPVGDTVPKVCRQKRGGSVGRLQENGSSLKKWLDNSGRIGISYPMKSKGCWGLPKNPKCQGLKMKSSFPRTRRKFRTAWDEIDYLYHKILFWFYDRGERQRAKRFSKRLKVLLRKVAADHEAILGESCRALVCELAGDLQEAIRHREKEIRQIHKLHRVSRDLPNYHLATQGYDVGDLSDRYDLLAILYHDTGDLERAIQTLRTSKELCEREGIAFDGQDLLDDFLKEKQAASLRNGKKMNRSAVGAAG